MQSPALHAHVVKLQTSSTCVLPVFLAIKLHAKHNAFADIQIGLPSNARSQGFWLPTLTASHPVQADA